MKRPWVVVFVHEPSSLTAEKRNPVKVSGEGLVLEQKQVKKPNCSCRALQAGLCLPGYVRGSWSPPWKTLKGIKL